MGEGSRVAIELSTAEALVLFELLTRWYEESLDTLLIKHQAEQRVLWDIQCILERQLTAPFQADYQDQVIAARHAVQDPQ